MVCCRNGKKAKAVDWNAATRCPGPRRPTIERPQCKLGRPFMKPIRLLSAVALLVATLSSAFAAEAVFPPGVRVGMNRWSAWSAPRPSSDSKPRTKRQGAGGGTPGRGLRRSRQRLQGHSGRHRRHQAGRASRPRRHGLLHRGKRQGWRQQCAALFDDPAGRHLLRLCRRAGSRECQQNLYRRSGAADVCVGRRSARKFRSTSSLG